MLVRSTPVGTLRGLVSDGRRADALERTGVAHGVIGNCMRILKIYDGDYPWDVRVEKMLRTLSTSGHEVTLLARNRQGRPRNEDIENVMIRRLPADGMSGALGSFPAFFHPAWVRAAGQVTRASSPERILVRDLPLAPLGLWLARRIGVPAIIDMAEPYPEALRSNWQFDSLGGLDHVLRSPRLADLIERRVLRHAPRTLVVSEESGERLERLGLPRSRWTLVGNTPELDRLDATGKRTPTLSPGWPGRAVLIFSGILVGDRGVEVAIRGLARLVRERGPTVGLIVIGDGRARRRYEEEAIACGVDQHVRFPGFLSHDELPAHWRAASIGLLPFHRCTHIDTTLANKLFDYMAVGLPVLASDARPMQRVLRETRCGETFRSGDDADFARVAARMLDHVDRSRAMGEAGRLAVQTTYHWGRDAERLLEAVARP